MNMLSSSRGRKLLAFIVFSLFVIVIVSGRWIPRVASAAIDLSYVLAPSALRALELGNRHFDARDPMLYDIGKARYFFEEALRRDPRLPLVRHELARVAFLDGAFPQALNLISQEIALPGGPASPSSYYVKGLIEGYVGKYDDAAKDYEKYLVHDPTNWAAINDYAWVLLKAKHFRGAEQATSKGLEYFPENAWLLNTNAVALTEMGKTAEARKQAEAAVTAVEKLGEKNWLTAYPGNDPQIAGEGLSVFKNAVLNNMHMLMLATSSHAVQLDLTHD